MSDPDFALVAIDSVVPNGTIFTDAGALFIAIGIVGATIMPHNLYLHSRLAMTRLAENLASPATLYRWSVLDTNISLFFAWFVNAAILVVAAAVFHPIFLESGTVVDSFDDAYKTLVPILSQGAGLIFAVALLASGIASSTSATLAGQIVFEGFWKGHTASPFLIRLGTRALTMAPALVAIILQVQPIDILVWSQVVLSLQLPFALIPLLALTGDRKLMGAMTIGPITKGVMWTIAAVLIVLNIVMLGQTFGLIPDAG